MENGKVGFIGLGIMGKPIALNLLKVGYQLLVLEKNKASGVLVEAGATSYASSKAVAKESDFVITMLPDSPDVEEVTLGHGGVLEGIKKDSIYIDMSTIAPSTSRQIYTSMQKKEVEALDAPVSGGEIGAKEGTVSIMVGGSEKAFKKARPLFKVMGKSIVHIGEAGAGQMTKACNQIIIGITMQAVSEAFSLAKKAGIDLNKVREALLAGYAQSRVLNESGKRMIERNFDPGFKIKLHRKDMDIALQTGKELSVPLCSAALVASYMDALLAQGKAEWDNSSMALLIEQMSNL